jgi:HK97 family phage portal protein
MIRAIRDMGDWLGLGKTQLDSKSMLGMPAVWYALQKIGGDIGKMPLQPRQTKPDGRGSDPLMRHPTWRLLVDQPNDWMTTDVFKELITQHALGWGNGRAAIVRQGNTPVELIPMLPDRTYTEMVQGQKFHLSMPEIDDPIMFRESLKEVEATGRIPSGMVVLPDRDVIHIIGLSSDGVNGLNIGRIFQDALGTGQAGHRLMNRQMKKGFTGRVMLSDPGGVFSGPDAEKEAQEFLKQFRQRYTAEKDGEVAGMLRRGMTAEVLSMSNADAQLIEQMKFSRQDVMLIFGLQHLPGDDSASSYNSLEQKKLDQLESTNDRWMTRWEQQLDMKLRTEAEKQAGRLYFKFVQESRLRTDIGTTANVLSTLVRATIMSRNEAREILEMNPVEGGDIFENPAITVREPVANLKEIKAGEARKIVALSQHHRKPADFEKAVSDFYDRLKPSLVAALGQEQAEQYIAKHLQELAQAKQDNQEITTLCNRWITDDK